MKNKIEVPATYAEAKAVRDQIEADLKAIGNKMTERFGNERGPMGLTPDHIKANPEWQKLHAENQAAFARLRDYNSVFTKVYAKEMKAERERIVAERTARFEAQQAERSTGMDLGSAIQ